MVSKVQAHTKGTATAVELPNGERFLLVEIAIDCPVCGPQVIRLAGHHLRAVRDLLIEFIDLHPESTGKDGDIQTIDRLRWEGEGGGTPEDN